MCTTATQQVHAILGHCDGYNDTITNGRVIRLLFRLILFLVQTKAFCSLPNNCLNLCMLQSIWSLWLVERFSLVLRPCSELTKIFCRLRLFYFLSRPRCLCVCFRSTSSLCHPPPCDETSIRSLSSTRPRPHLQAFQENYTKCHLAVHVQPEHNLFQGGLLLFRSVLCTPQPS